MDLLTPTLPVNPRLAEIAAPELIPARLAPTPGTRRVCFHPQVVVHGSDTPIGLLPEGPSASITERTALLPPCPRSGQGSSRRRRRLALRARPSGPGHEAWVTGAVCGMLMGAAWWTIAATRKSDAPTVGIPALLAMMASGFAVGGCIGYLAAVADDESRNAMRGRMVYEV